MTSPTLPPPASPFPPRPSPTPSSEPATTPALDESTPNGPISAKPLPVEFPLTSFASTPHNVACIAFLLGAVWSIGLSLFLANALSFSSPGWFAWSRDSSQISQGLPRQGWTTSLKSPQLGFYLASWSFFHLMEFVVTSMYNPGKLSVSSYLLDNGREYIAAHIAGVIEYVLEETFLPPQYRAYKHFAGTTLIGFALVLTGQTLRSFAMISASSNFSHLISFSKLPSHQLVTTGIYSWSRHPSYAGFYWWALGTQIALGNPICSLVFMATLQWFFSIRIGVEERYLVKFFGKAYEDYRAKVPSRIMFVR